MDREEIIRMAREAGFKVDWQHADVAEIKAKRYEYFAALVAKHEREKVAQWMTRQGYATGHGDNIEDLLKELEWQIEDRIKNIIRAKTYVMQNDLAESVEPDSP